MTDTISVQHTAMALLHSHDDFILRVAAAAVGAGALLGLLVEALAAEAVRARQQSRPPRGNLVAELLAAYRALPLRLGRCLSHACCVAVAVVGWRVACLQRRVVFASTPLFGLKVRPVY